MVPIKYVPLLISFFRVNPLFVNEDYPSSRMEDLPSSGYDSNPNTIVNFFFFRVNPLFENEDYPSSRMEDLPSSGYGSNPNTIGKSQPAKIKVETKISSYSSKNATLSSAKNSCLK